MNVAAKSISSIDWLERDYDGFICALGFEERARYIAENRIVRATVKSALGFSDRQLLSYRDNKDWFTENAFRVSELSDEEIDRKIQSECALISDGISGVIRLCVDVSSFNRFRIASIFNALGDMADSGKALEVDFLYSMAKAGREGRGAPVVQTGPIHPQFAGWFSDPDAPAAVVIGLGYEKEKAISAIEYIEPSMVFTFRTARDETHYYERVQFANRMLWDYIGADRNVEYRLSDLQSCFSSVESLVYGLLRSFRPILLPFGPKIFTCVCLAVAQLHAPYVSVWRSSYGTMEEPIDRFATSEVFGLRLIYNPKPPV